MVKLPKAGKSYTASEIIRMASAFYYDCLGLSFSQERIK